MIIRQAIDESVYSAKLGRLLPYGSTLAAHSYRDLINRALSCQSTSGTTAKPFTRERLVSTICAELHDLHIDPDTLPVKQALSKINGGAPIIVVSHQPTLLAYTGVWGQFELAKRLGQYVQGRHPVILFLSLDGDDSSDRRIHSAHYPSSLCQRGSLPLSSPYSSRAYRNIPQFLTPNLGQEHLTQWFNRILGVLGRESRAVGISQNQRRIRLNKIFDQLRTIADDTSTMAKFNTALLMHFADVSINDVVLPISMTKLCLAGKEQLHYLLSQWDAILTAASQGASILTNAGFTIHSSTMTSAPYAAWGVCANCHQRVRLTAQDAINYEGKLSYHGCEPRTSRVSPNGPVRLDDLETIVLPRVLIEDLLPTLTIAPLLSLTYSGSAEHIVVGQWTSKYLFGRPAPSFTSRPLQPLYGDVATSMKNLNAKQFPEGVIARDDRYAAARIMYGRESLLYAMFHKANAYALRWTQLGDLAPFSH